MEEARAAFQKEIIVQQMWSTANKILYPKAYECVEKVKLIQQADLKEQEEVWCISTAFAGKAEGLRPQASFTFEKDANIKPLVITLATQVVERTCTVHTFVFR